MVVDLLEADDVWMLEFPQVLNVGLLLLTHLLDGHLFRAELAQEDSSLCTTAQPLQLGNLLKWNLPHVWKQEKDILLLVQSSSTSLGLWRELFRWNLIRCIGTRQAKMLFIHARQIPKDKDIIRCQQECCRAKMLTGRTSQKDWMDGYCYCCLRDGENIY